MENVTILKLFFSSEFTRNEWVCFRTSAVVRAGVHGVAPLAPVADALDVHAAHLHHVHSAHGRDGHLRPGLPHRTVDLRARHSVSATRTYYRKEWKIFPIASMYPLNQAGIFFVHGFFFSITQFPCFFLFFFQAKSRKDTSGHVMATSQQTWLPNWPEPFYICFMRVRMKEPLKSRTLFSLNSWCFFWNWKTLWSWWLFVCLLLWKN